LPKIHRAPAAVAAAALAALAAAAPAAPARGLDRPWASDDARIAAKKEGLAQVRRAPDAQHGPGQDHLPAVRENMELVGKLRPSEPFGALLPNQIADVAVHRNTAYLMSWAPFDNPTDPTCKRGGFWSIDISDPANPRQLAFVPALPASYHGEGAHAITLNTAAFTGDVLAVNNEPCSNVGEAPGGFDLYDVSDPANPQVLVQGAGDRTPDGSLEEDGREFANSAHSIFIWQHGQRAFAIIADNTELHDVDIFDITDPRRPVMIAEHDLVELFPQILEDGIGYNSTVFLHDMVVKQIDGRPVMLADYWDAGYVQLDVTDPAAPRHIVDTGFTAPDPQVDIQGEDKTQEGNAHQAEFSHDDEFILAADEDFATYRPQFKITSGEFAGTSYPSGEFGFSRPIVTLPDGRLNGPTVYGGYGCTADNQIPPASVLDDNGLQPGEERILVVQRGPVGDPGADYEACRFDEKMANAIDKGYDGILIAQRHQGSEALDGAFCGSGDPRAIAGMCISHRAMHDIFGDEPEFGLPYSDTDAPAAGTEGERVEAVSFFDGWGYAHLYDRRTGEELDTFAIEEARDERYASGFGDLSIHEFATDPETNLAYAAYYSGGLRVFRFSRENGLEQVGKFIEEGGSDFWGVEQFTHPAYGRLIAGSDMDGGLVIVRYTGPGAVGPAEAPAQPQQPQQPAPPPGTVLPVPLRPTFFEFGNISRVTLSRQGRATLEIRVPGAGQMVANLVARIGTRKVTLASTSVRATGAGVVQLPWRVSDTKLRSLKRTIDRRRTRRTSATIRATFFPAGGAAIEKRTRNRSVSLTVAP
jgi:hypothetical protein